MGTKQELVAAVRARTEGTPYRLEETADGFDVGVDLVVETTEVEDDINFTVEAGQPTE